MISVGRSKARSRQAKAQSRGKDGKFVVKKVTLVVDEARDISRTSKPRPGHKPPKRTMSHVVSATDNPEKFGSISKEYRANNTIKGELKAKKRKPFQKIIVALRIHNTGAKSYKYYVNKDLDTPNNWDDRDREAVQRAMLKKSIKSRCRRFAEKR